MESVHKSLTSEQLAIVAHVSGNALCLAGAGTGKTTTMVSLYQQHAKSLNSSQIKVLMFNSDIKKDFENQLIHKEISPDESVQTYHVFCKSLLLESEYIENNNLKLTTDTKIANEWMRKILKEMSLSPRYKITSNLIKKPRTLGVLEGFISLIKAKLLSPKEVFESEGYNPEYFFLIDAFERFEELRLNNKILFFDDWLVEALNMLKKYEDFRNKVGSKLKLVIVDEFQDTNPAQYELLKLIKGVSTNIVAVGDVNQCIYKWRGSDPTLMLNFEKDFAPCNRYQLSQTFRFGHTLATASNHLISNNKERFSDFITVSAVRVMDTKIKICRSIKVVSSILDKITNTSESGASLPSMAILLRRWSQAMLLELGLIQKNIPYSMPEDSTLLRGREIGLMMSLMRLKTLDDSDNQQIDKKHLISELLKFPHCYLKTNALDTLCSALSIEHPSSWPSATSQISLLPQFVDNNFAEVLSRINLLSVLIEKKDLNAWQVFIAYRELSGLDEWLVKSEATESHVQETLDKLDALSSVLKGINKNCDQTLSYFKKIQAHANRNDNNKAGVKLTTIFRAKGAEFDQVFLPFWDADTFPFNHKHASGVCSDIEEERRLAYVAVTRAKRNAFIYVSETETSNSDPQKNLDSQFIGELKIDVASEFGSKLYLDAKLPSCTTIELRDYLQKLGRLNDCEPQKNMISNRQIDSEGRVGDIVKNIDGSTGTITSYDSQLFTVRFNNGSEGKFLTDQFEQYFKLLTP